MIDAVGNRKENLRSLCKCCHVYKDWTNKVSITPGRKILKTLDLSYPGCYKQTVVKEVCYACLCNL